MKLLQTTALVVLIFLGLSLSEAGMTETEPTYMPTLTVRDALKNVSEFEPEAEPDSTADEIPDPNMGGGAYAGLLLTDNEIRLLSSMVFLEANTQRFEGQQAVAEVALNRVLSPLFPDTVYDVLFQPEQFSVAPLIETTEPMQTNVDAVYAALSGDSPVLDENVLYFSRGPQNDRIAAHIGDHYFCYQRGAI